MKTRNVLIATTIILALIIQVLSVHGVDVSQLFSTSTYQCMKKNGISFVIPRGYCSYGAVDVHAVQNLKNAKAAGMTTHIYMFPCRGKSANAQVDQMINKIPESDYGMVWLDIQTNPSPGCSWSGHSHAQNCAYANQLSNRVKSKGKKVGIYASQYMWQSIMGSIDACKQLKSQQLWYPHYDNSASFSDFKAFGGWTKPNIKQYKGDTTLCGAGVDLNYHP